MHLQMFAPFLAADGLTVSEFVHREVEPLDKEVEQVLSLSRSLAALRFKSRRCLCGRALKRGGGECAFRPTVVSKGGGYMHVMCV